MNQHTQSPAQRAEALAQFSDKAILEELLRRVTEREHKAATARAAVILRDYPEALHPRWTVNKLCDLAMRHDLPVTAAFAAWEQLTADAPNVRVSIPAPIPGGFTIGQRVRDTESGALYTVLGAGLLTNHVAIQFDASDADGCKTSELYVTYLEPVNADV